MAEYEPEDSRNVTGTAATPDGRWTNKDKQPPKAVPQPGKPATAQEAAEGDAEYIASKRPKAE